MARTTVVVNRTMGLQARAAEEFTDLARTGDRPVTVSRPGQHPVEADRMLLVISMEIVRGEEIVIDGPDEALVAALAALVARDDSNDPEPVRETDWEDLSLIDPDDVPLEAVVGVGRAEP